MNRNKIDANKTIFKAMIDSTIAVVPELSHFVKVLPRWVNTHIGSSNFEPYLVKSDVVSKMKVLAPGLCAGMLSYQNISSGEPPQYFVSASGALLPAIITNSIYDGADVLMEAVIHSNPGLFVVAAAEGLLSPVIDENNAPAVINLIAEREGSFEIDELLPFWAGAIFHLSDARIIEVNSAKFQDSVTRCIGLLILSLAQGSANQKFRAIPKIPDSLILMYKRALLCNEWSHISPVLFSSMMSHVWQHRYLDVYRCFERIFAVRRVSDWLSKIDHSIWDLSGPSRDQLAIQIQDVLGWKPHEENALTAIIANLSASCRYRLLTCIPNYSEYDPSRMNDSAFISRQIYKIRNEIAHYRTNYLYIDNVKNPNQLVEVMLESLVEAYTHSAKCLCESNETRSLM